MELKSENLLLNDRLAPITTAMGFIEANHSTIVKEFLAWQNSIKAQKGIIITDSVISGSLEDILLMLIPLRMADRNRYLFIPSVGNWTAYIDNGYRGTDPSAIGFLAERCECKTIYLVAKPHALQKMGKKRKGRQGALILEIYGPEQTEWLNLIRQIRLENDAGKWEFEQFGSPFPFEDKGKYTTKRIKDRFTFDMVNQYLNEFGISAFNEDFYLPLSNPHATLVELSGNLPPNARDVSFEEARKLNFID